MISSQGLLSAERLGQPLSALPQASLWWKTAQAQAGFLSCVLSLTGSVVPRPQELLPRAPLRERTFPLESSKGAGQLRAPYSEWPEGGWIFRGYYVKSHGVGRLWRVM